ncbi:MAG: hypothetical protein HOW73_09590 [Polyangiaceae bacterium]|nr:hypothetical protein [Polyangiaceae bacterium]
MAFVWVALAAGSIVFVVRARRSSLHAGRVRTAAVATAIAWFLMTAVAVTVTAAATVRWKSRPSAEDYASSLAYYELLEMPLNHASRPRTGEGARPPETLLSDAAIEVTRRCDSANRSCVVYVDVRDGLGPRGGFSASPHDQVGLWRTPDHRLWQVTVTSAKDGAIRRFVAGRRGPEDTICAHHLAGVIAPPPATIGFAFAACMLLGATTCWLVMRAWRLKRVLRGTEATLRANGWLELDGARAPVHVEGPVVPPGPVIWLSAARDRSADYRGREVISSETLISGTMRDRLAAHSSSSRLLIPIALMITLYLSAPLAAALCAGLIF